MRLKTGRLYRTFTLDRGAADADARTVPVSFSSETPVDRWFGREVLDHGPKSVRLDRLRRGGPLLLDHDPGQQIGVVERAEVGKDGRGRAVVRFGRSPRATEVFQDVVDGIRQNVSVGYVVHRMTQEGKDADGTETFRATDWEPLEVSIVAVPADVSVGVGRTAEDSHETLITRRHGGSEATMQTNEQTPDAGVTMDERSAAAEGRRVTIINQIADNFSHLGPARELARQFVENGKSADEYRAALLEATKTRHKPTPIPSAHVDLRNREGRRYSLLALVRSMMPGEGDVGGLEREVSQDIARMRGKEPSGLYAPNELVFGDLSRRDLEYGGGESGKTLVGTDHLAGHFIDALRNRPVVIDAGATVMSGLVGNVSIPRQSTTTTAYWVAEGGSPTEGAPAMDAVTMTPKTVAAYVDIMRRPMKQATPAADAIVTRDVSRSLSLAADLAALHGTGSNNQPTGVAATSGIGSVAGGTNGGAPTLAHLLELEEDVSVANGDRGSLAYITNPVVRRKLKGTLVTATYGDRMVWGEGDRPLNGYPAHVTNQVSSTLTKGTASGVCSAIFFGAWQELLFGMWGGIDVIVDPYTLSTSGGVRIAAHLDMDIAVRHAASFSAMLDALTT